MSSVAHFFLMFTKSRKSLTLNVANCIKDEGKAKKLINSLEKEKINKNEGKFLLLDLEKDNKRFE